MMDTEPLEKRGKTMYTASVYASANRDSNVRTFFIETYSWPAMRAALAGVKEDFAWVFVNNAGMRVHTLREPQTGEWIEYKVGTEAQLGNNFMGALVLSNTAD